MSKKLILIMMLVCLLIPMGMQAQHVITKTPRAFQVGVKSNLLGVIVGPEVGLEIGVGGKVSLSVDAFWPNWKHSKIIDGTLWGSDLRYWFTKWNRPGRQSMCGNFIGAYYSEGRPDIQAFGKGYQSEIQTYGLEFGHVFHIFPQVGDRLRLELCLGVGYASIDYDRYYVSADNETLNYQYSGHRDFWGPTRASVSVQFLLFGSKKKLE